ncbi:MAG: CocE/NonD family hydrolase [Thermotogae bacterium]|nr:CocE/NonD family hydrolase [Thermotogota bacterium]
MWIIIAYSHDFVMVPMRDSVRLATDIYKPTFYSGQLHTILIRTPYGRTDVGLSAFIPYITDVKGYALVIQSVRGFQGSEGDPQVFKTDAWGSLQDGYDAVSWIISQPWSSGKVCGAWFSAMGITQYLLSGTYHPAYKCAVPLVGAHSMYHYAAFQGGEFRKNLVEGWLGGLGTPFLIDSVANHPLYDSTWQLLDLNTRIAGVNVPMLHFAGWFDLFLESQIEAFNRLQFEGAPLARGNQKLIIGPWTHLGFGQTDQGDMSFPSEAGLSVTELVNMMGTWYDYWLRGESNGADDWPPVRFYVIGLNRWVEADTFPPRGVYYRNWYLRGDGTLSLSPPPSADSFSTYVYDPDDPTPSIGGNEMDLPGGDGPKDQRPLLSRSDVLIFQTPPLTDTLVIIGSVKAKLYVSSDRYDTDFIVRLADVYPDGRAILISDGITKARFRYGFDREVFLTPGEIDSLEVKVWSTAWAIMPGHRLMVIISSASYPRFEANPNTGAPFQRNDTFKLIATNRVYHTALYPSYLSIPILPTTEVLERKDVRIAFELKGSTLCLNERGVLYDASGRMRWSGRGCSPHLPKGVYFLKVKDEVRRVILR